MGHFRTDFRSYVHAFGISPWIHSIALSTGRFTNKLLYPHEPLFVDDSFRSPGKIYAQSGHWDPCIEPHSDCCLPADCVDYFPDYLDDFGSSHWTWRYDAAAFWHPVRVRFISERWSFGFGALFLLPGKSGGGRNLSSFSHIFL